MTRARYHRKAVAISDLAEMGFCERKVMLKAQIGDIDTPESARRRHAGSLHHEAFDRQVQRHHNTRGVRDARCFIATAVYGLKDPRTEELRRFRDRKLATTGPGRLLISVYYVVSPRVARWLDRSPTGKLAVRRLLDRVRNIIRSSSREGGAT